MTTEDMVRGLVRAAEFKEQEDGGRVWGDEVRAALDEARRRGWGKNQVGNLAAPTPPKGDSPPTDDYRCTREAGHDTHEFRPGADRWWKTGQDQMRRCLRILDAAPTPGSTTGGDVYDGHGNPIPLCQACKRPKWDGGHAINDRECTHPGDFLCRTLADLAAAGKEIVRTCDDLAAALKREGEARELLGRAVKYAIEDKAYTPGSTRLARLILESRRFLGIPEAKGTT